MSVPQFTEAEAWSAFCGKVQWTPACWNWTGGRTAQGYGSFRTRNWTDTLAHRIAYECLVGAIPSGFQLHHTCGNRTCVNPEHLVVITPGDHTRLHRAEITYCPQGHPYDEKNTYIKPNGSRECRICRREGQRLFRQRHLNECRAYDRARYARKTGRAA